MPARLEPDGRLRVQLKPGNWTISLTARQRGPVETLARAEVAALWPQQEIWSFQAQNALRVVQLSGAPALDPAQTNVPAEWRPWPAYLLQPGEALRFITRTRGDTETVPEHLTLHRSLWLDFAGGGYTVQDHLSGNLNRTRLEAAPAPRLGRVEINGDDQFITQLSDAGTSGVEVRQSNNLQLVADSRLEPAAIGDLPAVGWQIAPQKISATLTGRVELNIAGWLVERYIEGRADRQLQLTRQRQTAATPLQAGVMPPFVQVEREIVLDVDWKVETRVRRLSQADSAVVVDVPLLPGERVTTPDIRVRDGRVSLNLPPNQVEVAWSATLNRGSELVLQAAERDELIEVWRLRAGPLWHVRSAGIPLVRRIDAEGRWLPEWRPWPGERVTLQIGRPDGAPGTTATIDRRQGLLGAPDMQVAGHHSSVWQLNWDQDRTAGPLPTAWVISAPLWLYRGLMLAWALWLALAVLRWLGWAWGCCFSVGGLWRRLRKVKDAV
ncbi:MAG: hypothetical protein WBQ93_02605 [Candidatus Competibacter sp.]